MTESKQSSVKELIESLEFLENAIAAAVGYLKSNKPELALLVLEGTKGFNHLQDHYAKHD